MKPNKNASTWTTSFYVSKYTFIKFRNKKNVMNSSKILLTAVKTQVEAKFKTFKPLLTKNHRFCRYLKLRKKFSSASEPGTKLTKYFTIKGNSTSNKNTLT